MAPFEALYGRRCRSPIGWFEIREAELIGLDLVYQAMEKDKIIKERLKTAQSHKKSYSDVHRRDLEFKEYDWVFLKVSPMKGIMRFGKNGKLSPRYGGPYKIIQRIGLVAYKLELPPEMSLVHPIFHASMLKKVVGDPSAIVPVETIEVNEELLYAEIPVAILDRQVRKLRNKEITSSEREGPSGRSDPHHIALQFSLRILKIIKRGSLIVVDNDIECGKVFWNYGVRPSAKNDFVFVKKYDVR
ncbi:uncharacterized protein [Nicotiana tomentosiformis]|uniref:uncharacterized protein n=1 Tax=Nicotiana tomentosiformis TaxID=4098 RepID=UPI00388C897D